MMANFIVFFFLHFSFILQYAAKEFGTCPLVQCNGQPVLPVGLRDEIGVDTGKIFCPKCKSVYQPPPIRTRSHSSNGGGGGAVDGAAFGTTFPHLFLMTFNNLVPDPLPPNSAYIPRVFGFRVHQSAHSHGRGGNPAISNNGRGARASYAQRHMANMTSTRATRGSGGGGGGAVPVQVTTTGVMKEETAGGAVREEAKGAGKAAALTPKPSKKPVTNDDGGAAAEGGDGAKAKAEANDVGADGNPNSPKKRVKSDGGKNGSVSSNDKKRQKRGADVIT